VGGLFYTLINAPFLTICSKSFFACPLSLSSISRTKTANPVACAVIFLWQIFWHTQLRSATISPREMYAIPEEEQSYGNRDKSTTRAKNYPFYQWTSADWKSA
jgi:hypothetical protein